MRRNRAPPLLALALAGLLLGHGDAPPPAIGQPSQHPSPSLDSLTAAAESLYRAGDYLRARDAWALGLTRIQADRDVAGAARALTSLSLAEWRLGEYDSARQRGEQARALLEKYGLLALLPRTYNALGLIAWDQGRMAEAADLWRLTMRVARETGDEEYVDKPAMNLGLWYAGIGDLDRASQAFGTSLAAGRRLGIRALELRSLVNLAMVANRAGEPRLALRWLDSAAAARVEDDFLAADNYRSQLAIAAWSLGEPGIALAGLDRAVRDARRAGFRQSEAANLTLMADIYWEAGDPIRALGLHARAGAIHGELGLPTEQGQNLQSSARIQTALGHPAEGRNLAARALALHQRAEDGPAELDDRLLLAELGDPGQMSEARRIATRLATRAARMKLALTEARLAEGRDRPREVLRSLGALDLGSALSAEVAEAEGLRVRAYAAREQWDSAAAAGRRAIGAVERVRDGHGSGALRASFASFRAELYGEVVAALLAAGRVNDALEIADGAHGKWTQDGGLPPPVDGARRSGAAREALRRRVAMLEAEIESREDEGLAAGELRDRLAQAEREFEIAVLSAGDAPSRGRSDGGSSRRVREVLRPDELLLDYLVTPTRLFVFTLSRDSTRVRVIPVGAGGLEARVRLIRQLLADPAVAPADFEAALDTLSHWLLGPVRNGVGGVRSLIVVPHGVLTYLPFSALRTADGRYLIERYALVHQPSVSFGARGSPEIGPGVKITALAPLTRQLPATAMEVRAIVRVRRGAVVLTGRRAGEPALRQALRSGNAVHVASHGVLNGLNPLFTRIELAPGRSGSPADDGRLEVHEVLDLGIASPLVFLSGCETGVGPGGSRRYAPGEDYTTLAASFLTSGAGQVVATLWAIPDTGAAVFAGRFYRELGARGVAESLAAAQRAMLADPRYHHPYYWAAYRLARRASIRESAAVS